MTLPFHAGQSADDVRAAAGPLIHLVRRAGQTIEAVQARREDAGIDLQRKGDDSPVTAADHASHALLVPGLEALWPDIPVVSEESWTPGDPIPGVAWVVDPLDGTKEFLVRNGEYVVNVGLMQDALPVFGAVHVPATGSTFIGGPGMGAWQVHGDTWTPLAPTPFEGSILRVVASRSHRGPLVDRFLAGLEAAGIRSEAVPMGSAWKLLLVADGRADAYPRLGPTMWWDTLAPQAVVEGAGGRVLDSGGKRFRYVLDADGAPRNRYFLVLGPPGPRDTDLVRSFQAAGQTA